MNIVHVIPLSRGVFKEELTYFTSKNLLPGTLVSVPVRSRNIPALVVRLEPAADAKSKLRSSTFPIRKIEETGTTILFSPEFIEAATQTARHFAATPGEVIQALTPKTILTEYAKEAAETKKTARNNAREHKTVLKPEHFVFQADDEERASTYKSLIREEFARGSSVFFCLPTIQDIERTVSSLERGIKEYTYVLHSKLSKKKMLDTWKAALADKHPVLIVATGSFLSFPRDDVRTLILDREHAQSYKTMNRPYIDIRVFAEKLADKRNLKLILGDTFLRPETIWRHEQGELIEFAPLKFRALSTAEHMLVDMRAYRKEGAKAQFRVISDELEQLITDTKKENAQLFVLAARKGLSSITVCNDCGSIVICDQCAAPLVLHTDKTRPEGTVFVCHKCGVRTSSERVCSHCNSWRLTDLGVGVEKVYKAIKESHPEMNVFLLDSESANTAKKAQTIADEFFNTPGSVLVGTEMALAYLDHPLTNSAVASIDSLFTIPDLHINEKIFNILMRLYTTTQKTLLIQTRDPEQPVFQDALQGNLLEFYRAEIAARKQFAYPPFSTCIKLTIQGRKPAVQKELGRVSELLADYDHVRYPSFTEELRGAYRENLLIRLPRGKWVDEHLLKILKALPPAYMIKVDPDSVL